MMMFRTPNPVTAPRNQVEAIALWIEGRQDQIHPQKQAENDKENDGKAFHHTVKL